MNRSATEARPGTHGRETGAPPTACTDCRLLNRPCPHVRAAGGLNPDDPKGRQPLMVLHTHSRNRFDDACYLFLQSQVRGETGQSARRADPDPLWRTTAGEDTRPETSLRHESAYRAIVTHVSDARPGKSAKTMVLGSSSLSDAHLNEFGETDSRVSRAMSGSLRAALTHRITAAGATEPAQALYPGLASVIRDALSTSSRNPARKWLRLALTGESAATIAARANQNETDITQAINSTANRVCRNELSLRFRDDLLETAS